MILLRGAPQADLFAQEVGAIYPGHVYMASCRCTLWIVKTASTSARLPSQREAQRHRLVAGNVSLDFINTLNGHDRPKGHEYLQDFRDLVLWSEHAGLLQSGQRGLGLRTSSARPVGAAREFRGAIRLRESLFRLFTDVVRGRYPQPGVLRDLNAAWTEGPQHARIFHSGNRLAVGWDDDPILRSISRSLTSSAVALLTSPELDRIGMYSGDQCDWLFLDSSRNRLRRWCSMDECGNRAKMRRRRGRRRSLRVVMSSRSIGFDLVHPLPAAARPQARTLAWASDDHPVRLFGAADEKLLASRNAHTGAILDAAFTRDGTLLITAGTEETIRI